MGSVGCAYVNAMAESFLGTIKNEASKDRRFKNRDEVEQVLFAYLEGFYTPRRRHTALGKIAPMEYERRLPPGAVA